MARSSLRLVLALLTVGLVATPFAAASHEATEGASQVWNLGAGASSPRTMVRENHPGGVTGDATVPAESTVLWLADEAAAAAFDMGGDDHTFTLTLLVIQGSTINTRVGVYTPGTTPAFASCGTGSTSFGPVMAAPLIAALEDARALNVNFVSAPAACAFAPGQYLAVEVSAVGGDAKFRTTDMASAGLERSHLTFGPTPPSYPTPELGTLVLVAAGVVGIAGSVRFRSR